MSDTADLKTQAEIADLKRQAEFHMALVNKYKAEIRKLNREARAKKVVVDIRKERAERRLISAGFDQKDANVWFDGERHAKITTLPSIGGGYDYIIHYWR